MGRDSNNCLKIEEQFQKNVKRKKIHCDKRRGQRSVLDAGNCQAQAALH